MRQTKQCQWIIGDGKRAGQQCKNAMKDEASGCCRWHARLYLRREQVRKLALSSLYGKFPGRIERLDNPPPL